MDADKVRYEQSADDRHEFRRIKNVKSKDQIGKEVLQVRFMVESLKNKIKKKRLQ